MAKEWILNSAMNRFKLNSKRNVGPTSKEIRKCGPKEKDDWENYYFENVRSEEHIEESGKRLYEKIKKILPKEIEQITEDDCIQYMHEVVINRTFKGYMTEIGVIYENLQDKLNVKIEPASDEWDRVYNVDHYIKIKNKYIGLQIKPVRGDLTGEISHIMQIFTEQRIQAKSHVKFREKFGGEVFYIYSTKKNKKYLIVNEEIIPEIIEEIKRLENS